MSKRSAHANEPRTRYDYQRAASAPNSQRAYETDLKLFRVWGGRIPSTPAQLADYLAAYARKRKVATLERWLSSISKAHDKAGVPRVDNPCQHPEVRETMRGIRRKHGKPQRQVTPAVLDVLLKMVGCIPESITGVRDRALLLVGFAAALRRSELASLEIDAVRFDSRGMVIQLGKTKTDQEAMGAAIAVPFAKRPQCPVKALKLWLAAVKESKHPRGPIFRRISKAGNIHRDALNDATVARIVKHYATAANYDAVDFSGHSLRAGLATAAAIANKDPRKIKAQTRHKKDASLQRYIRDAELFQNNAADL